MFFKFTSMLAFLLFPSLWYFMLKTGFSVGFVKDGVLKCPLLSNNVVI